MNELSNYYFRKPKPTKEHFRGCLRFLRDRFSVRQSRNTRSIRGLKDSKKGRKCVIVCNGPSLNETNWNLLKNVDTIGLNKIFLKFETEAWRPNYIVCVNPLVIEQSIEEYRKLKIPLFVPRNILPLLHSRENTYFLKSFDIPCFSKDISVAVWQGFTVTYVALQIAYYLGYHEVALIGCDHYFKVQGFASETQMSSETDLNHFDPRYFSGTNTWQLPDIEGSEFAYRIARDSFKSENKVIYNCTAGGSLELFKRKSLQEFLDEKKS